MQVAQTAFTAFGKKGFFTVLIQVGNCLTGIQVGNHGSDRNTKLNIGSTSAVAVTAAAVFAVLGLELTCVAIIDQSIQVSVGNGINRAAAAAVSAVGTAFRNKLSRRNEATPFPPLPAKTSIFASSTNFIFYFLSVRTY